MIAKAPITELSRAPCKGNTADQEELKQMILVTGTKYQVLYSGNILSFTYCGRSLHSFMHAPYILTVGLTRQRTAALSQYMRSSF